MIKVATLNTWQGTPPLKKRLELICRAIGELKPDILLLQEVFFPLNSARSLAAVEKSANIIDRLESALGYTCVSYPARKKVRRYGDCEIESFSGLAIATLGYVSKSEIVVLPSVVEDGERNALLALIQLENWKGWVVNTHLTHLDLPVDLRIRQAEHLLTRLSKIESSLPIVLGGDLNADPSSEILRMARQRNFVDFPLYPELEPSTLIPYFRGENDTKSRQIDHLMVRAAHSTMPSYQWTPWAFSKLDTPDAQGVYASDHKLIYIEGVVS